jgi:hypothetical protein
MKLKINLSNLILGFGLGMLLSATYTVFFGYAPVVSLLIGVLLPFFMRLIKLPIIEFVEGNNE